MGLMRKVEIKGKELRKGREIIWMGDIYVEIYEVPFLQYVQYFQKSECKVSERYSYVIFKKGKRTESK